MHMYIWKKFRIRLNLFRITLVTYISNLFRITVYFFLTDTCIGIIKSSGVICPNNKFPDKSSAGLTRLDCICDYNHIPLK